MMKLKISTVIEIPDTLLLQDDYRFDSAVQLVFDAVTNYATVAHLRDATKWLAKSKEDKTSTEYLIFKHHQYWGRVLGDTRWEYEEVK
jgi:hypothetical protein